VLLAATVGATPTAGAQASPPGGDSNHPLLRLTTGNVDLAAMDETEAVSSGRYVVQFDRPVTTTDASALEADGAKVIGYLPDNSFAVRVPDGASIPEMADVSGIVNFEPGWRISPDLADGQTRMLRVAVDEGVDPATVIDHLQNTGLEVLGVQGQAVLAITDGSVSDSIADHPAISWIGPYRRRVTHNESAGSVIGTTAAIDAGYDGSTQIVAVADTGLGDGTSGGAHPDIPASRIVAIEDWDGSNLPGCWTSIDDGAQDADSGHGTHTTGSVLSDGAADGTGRGSAPGASLVFQAVEDYLDFTVLCETLPGNVDGYYLQGLPEDLNELFLEAYDLGARIHSDSWGTNALGEYDSNSVDADQFIWDNPDFLIVTSAGNSGIDDDADGVIDDDSIGSPATAKNVLTVGASEGSRADGSPCDGGLTYDNDEGVSCADQGGANILFLYGDAWPEDYPADPIASDSSAGNAEQMAAFSSRGPTDDGRIKPDVVAPGTWILSTYSPLYQEGYGDPVNPQNALYQSDGWGFPANDEYKYFGGTSMSAPLVAGGAALVRDYYNLEHGIEASAALVKATLINSAVDLLDENNDGHTVADDGHDNDFPIPNVHEGWGRVDVAAAVDGSRSFVDDGSLELGATDEYEVEVTEGQPLKITLVWSDFPATDGAGATLVNNLDLVVTGPAGSTTYLGNNFLFGWTVPGGSADTVNNVENVYVQAAGAGTWTVQVAGRNVPEGPQPYALVIAGDFPDTGGGPGPVDPPPGDTTPPVWSSGSVSVVNVLETKATVRWPAATDASGIDSYTVEVDAGGALTLLQADGAATSVEFTGLGPAVSYTVTVTATDPDGNNSAGLSGAFATAIDFSDTNGHLFEEDIAWLSGRGITQGCTTDSFCPGDGLTRAQMASLLVRAFDLPAVSGNRFSDVSGIHTANINALAEAGITLGCNASGTDFCPDDPVSRAQMATFLTRAFGLTSATTDWFTDDTGSPHEAGINALAESGITLGCGVDVYCPSGVVNRGQIAAFLHRGFVILALE